MKDYFLFIKIIYYDIITAEMIYMKKNLTMNEMFKGYLNYSNDEYSRIWKDALIVVDTNILLNFFRYSKDTRKILFDIFDKLKARLWIPYQVGKEFFKSKNKVMVNSYNEYDSLLKTLNKTFDEALNEINKKKNTQLKCKEKIQEIIKSNIKEIEHLLINEKNEKVPKFKENDVEEKILNLFNECIGEDFDSEEYETIKKEGINRINNKIAPGYKDSSKSENGDYYIFYSLIKKAKNDNKDIIFITDDVKEDWFNEYNGEKHGGNNELLNEFYEKTGKLLMIYTSDGFVKAYNKNIENKLPDENLIKELINIRNEKSLINNRLLLNKNNYYFSNIINNYKKILNNSSNDINKTDIIEDLYFAIEHLDISNYKKNILQKELIKINKSRDYSNNSELLDILNHILFYYEKISNNNLLTNIKHNYIIQVSELSKSTSNKHFEFICNKVAENINKNLDILKTDKNYNFDIIFKLENALEDINSFMNGDHLKRKDIINDIKDIISAIDDKTNSKI